MSHQSTTTCYTFNNKGCHKSSNFPTTKVFTVYLDKNTLYSVGNPKRKEIEAVFHDERNTLLLRIDCFPISRYLTLQKFSYLNWPLQMGDKIHAYIKKRPIRPANQRWVRAQIVIFAICGEVLLQASLFFIYILYLSKLSGNIILNIAPPSNI